MVSIDKKLNSTFEKISESLNITSDRQKALCPVHNGHSLEVSQLEKCVSIKCWSGCDLTKLETELNKVLDFRFVHANGCLCVFAEDKQDVKEEPVTLESLATYCGVSRGYLINWGCFEYGDMVGIPYFNSAGEVQRTRWRVKLRGKDKYIWKKIKEGEEKKAIPPYGLKWLAEYVSKNPNPDKPLFIVEGETDTWSLTQTYQPALGLPGAKMAGKLKAEHVKPFTTIYVWKETDTAGGNFATDVICRIKEIAPDVVVKVICQEVHKDPCEFLKAGGKIADVDDWLVSAESYLATPTETTQLDMAINFAKWVKEEFRFNSKLGGWLSWDGCKYCAEGDHLIFKKFGDYHTHLTGTLNTYKNPKIRKKFENFLLAQKSNHNLKGTIDATSNYLHIRESDLDTDSLAINLTNGWLNLRDLVFSPHKSPSQFTKVAGTEFNPDATCPLWEQCVSDYWEDNDIRRHFQQQCGVLLSGEQIKQMMYFYGVGNNGKTLIFEVMTALLGTYAVSVPIDSILQNRYSTIPCDVARMRGARLVTTSEIPDGRPLNESLVKQLTGGGTISARYLHKNPFEFRPQLKLWFDGNYQPTLSTDSAIWDRLTYLPFTRQFQKDGSLLGRLKMELPGILNWCIRGWEDYKMNGLILPEKLQSEKDTFMAESNPYKQFINLFFTRDPAEMVTKRDVWNAFVYWWRENHPSLTYVPNTRRFTNELKNLGLVEHRATEGRYWKGIKPNQDFKNASMGEDCPV